MILLQNRQDRLGSNLSNWLARYILGHYKKAKFKVEGPRFNSIFERALLPLIELAPEGEMPEELPFDPDFLDITNAYTVLSIQQDLFSYFREHIKDDYYQILKSLATYTVPWEGKVTCLHLRLGDMAFKSDYDGEPDTVFFRNRLNSLDANFASYVAYSERGLFAQHPLSEQKILKILPKDYPVVIVTDSPELVPLLYPNLKYPIFSSSPDNDLWSMIHSTILIASRSTFALMAAYVHQGEKVFIPMWSHPAAMGLTSKYDKSNFDVFY